MTTQRTPRAYRLDPEIVRQVEELAELTRRSRTAVVEVAVGEMYEREMQRRRERRESGD